MGHTFTVSDEQFARLEQFARNQGQSIDDIFQAWVNALDATINATALEAARARWAALGQQIEPPTDEELRAHPLLRVIGIASVNEPGWTGQVDSVFGRDEEFEPHADK